MCQEAGKCTWLYTSIRSAKICDATKPLAPVKKTLLLLCDMVRSLLWGSCRNRSVMQMMDWGCHIYCYEWSIQTLAAISFVRVERLTNQNLL